MISRKQRQSRSDEEWLSIITECRQSGLSDSAWCEQHDIPQSTFYSAVSRLRKKACAVPDSSRTARHTLDLTSSHQDVVQIDICDDCCPSVNTSVMRAESEMHLDNSYMIELTIGSIDLKVSNHADISLLSQLLRILGVVSC